MSQLSSALWMLKPRYHAVIIGSGYGGAIAANRLSRARRPDGTAVSVCVLERGNEIPTGEFPDGPDEAYRHSTLDRNGKRDGAENGLYHFIHDEEVTVIQGCGLGGTSLINANVSLVPEARVFKDKRWPRAFQDDVIKNAGGKDEIGGRLKAGFDHAKAMLRPQEYPEKANGHDDGWNGRLPKYDALKGAAGTDAKVYRAPINVNLKEGVNHVGVHQKACSGCGDCVSGCNVGAKNTLTKNYLPDARTRGAEIFCGIEVRSVARRGNAWAVYYVPVGHQRKLYDAPELFVLADLVIVSAGSLGSTEILLRSRARGLACSKFVGEHFTGNGDVLGFAYNGDNRVNGVGRGKTNVAASQPGPTITGVIDLRDTKELGDAFIVEEGALPSAMKKLLPAAFKVARKAVGKNDDHSFWRGVKQWSREAVSIVTAWTGGGAYRGSIANTLTFLTMSYDDGLGRLRLDPERDRVRIEWPDVSKQSVWQLVEKKFRQLSTTTGATYVPSPLFTKYFKFDVLTVHPLGGCILGDDAAGAAVNDRGQVFSGDSGSAAHDDLYVMDGSIIPSPVGVNPLLTISAVSERNVRLLIEDRGWTLEEGFTGKPVVFDGTRDQPRPATLQFSERMTGFLTPSSADFAAAADEARGRGHTATAVYGIMSPDLDAMIADPDRAAKLTGTLHIPALSPDPMTIFDGAFNLFVNVDGKAHKRMRYRMKLAAIDGKQYYFDGFKQVSDHRGIDVYSDTTVLHATVHENDKDGPVVAKGIMKISADDVLNLIKTMSAHDRDGKSSILERARFGKLFIGDLWDVYGIKEKLARL
jgi:cholesterol oxidase